MRVFRDIHALPVFEKAVVTIGSYDGVHSGHKTILEKVKALAKEVGGESVVVTFHPHPRQIIYPKDQTLQLLSTIDEKIDLLENLGIQNLVIVPFTVEFSQISADEYIQDFLMERFNPSFIVIGYDHRFGLNRQGDLNYLKWYSEKAAFEVIEIEKQAVDNLAISSSKIREFLSKGDVKKSAKLLGHFYTLRGKVVEGQKIGTTLGFPTANILPGDPAKLIPPNGIYAAFVLIDKKRYRAMLYIGTRPTLKNYHHQTIEVNIFDFNGSLYGQELTVEMVDFIRHDSAFDSLDALKLQLAKDKAQALEKLELIQKEPGLFANRKKPRVGVVILNYNGKHFLKKFLPSVLGIAYPDLKTWVADNGSSDKSIEFLNTYYPNVRLIEIKENQGFAEGYNQALAKIQGEVDYYVLLNSDVEVTHNWLTPIIQMMEDDNTVAACQPKILSEFNKRSFEYAGASGGWIDKLGYPFCRGRILSKTEMDERQYDDPAEIFWATGAAMVIRSKLYHAIGGLDGDYFAHMEEIDLCWRLKNAGFKIMVQPQAVIYHVGGGTLSYNTPGKTFLNFRNSLFTLVKNEPAKKLLWLIPLRLLLDGLAGGLFLVEGKFGHIWSILRAHFQFYIAFPKLLVKRRKVKLWVAQTRIRMEPNPHGIYNGSIIWDFYVRRIRKFSELKK